MIAHTVIFTVFLVIFTYRFVLAYYTYFDLTLVEACKLTKAYAFGKVTDAVVNICMVTLFSYITLETRKPLPLFWKGLLEERMKDAQKKFEYSSSMEEREQAERFHSAAIKDANRYIEVLRALI